MKTIIERIIKLVKNENFLIAFIILFAFILRLYKIDNPIADWHSWRQADTASVTKIYLEEGIKLFYPRYHDISSIQTGIFNKEGFRFVEFPIYNAVHTIFVKTYPKLSLEIWGRAVSILSALFSTYFLFLIGRKFMGKWGGLLSAFFYAYLPYNIYFTRVVLPEPMTVTFGLLSLWLFIKFLDNDKTWLLYSSSLMFSCAMLIKPFSFFYAIPIIYLAINKYGLKKLLTDARFLIAIDIALVPFFLWRVWINKFPAGIPFWEWAFNGDKIRFRPAFWRWIFGERLGYLILGIWGVFPFSLGLLKSFRSRLFIHFFILGMFLYVITFATANVRHDYYQIIAVPAIALVLAQGTLAFWESKQFKSWLAKLFFLFVIAMMFLVSAIQVREFYKVNHPEIISAGKALDRIASKDAWVIAPYNGDTAFLYQTGRRGWPAIDDSIDRIIEKGADYYISVNLKDPDTKNLKDRFKTVLETNDYVIIDLHQLKEK